MNILLILNIVKRYPKFGFRIVFAKKKLQEKSLSAGAHAKLSLEFYNHFLSEFRCPKGRKEFYS